MSFFTLSCLFVILESQSWALCSGVWSSHTTCTCSWFSSTSVCWFRLGPGHGCHWHCGHGRCCFWGQLRAICLVLLQPKQITSLTLFWAFFELATACPHLFPPGMKSSASASLAHVRPGDVSISSYFGAPNGAFCPCWLLRSVLKASKRLLNPSCHPFRWTKHFCCLMAATLHCSYVTSGGWMLYNSLYMLYGSPVVNMLSTNWSLMVNPA